MIEALTDNRTRTAGDVRMVFTKFGGNMGASGCVGFMFESRGQIVISPQGVDGDKLMELAIEAGADDVTEPGEEDAPWVITTAPLDFLKVKGAVEKAGMTIESAALTLIPGNTVRIEGDNAKNLLKLIDMLEDNDDVQKVYSNYEISDEELAALEG